MTTINIAYEVSDKTVAKIREHLDHVALYDVNWSGADFRLERDDYTYIPGADSYAAVTLLYQIIEIIAADKN